MATVIYNCKRCKIGKRIEYPIGDRNRGWSRTDSSGKSIKAGIWIQARIRGFIEYDGDQEFGICPQCHRAMDYGTLKAFLRPEQPCDARCTNARGHNCECSCGGINHGKAA